jgi:hypothetical protein
MVSIRRLLVAGLATLMLASACTTISSPPTIPPINIPTLPPINIPTLPPINLPSGINFPSIPPINLPSGGINFPSIPPISLPSGIIIPPIAIPSGQVPCSLVTSAEVQQIMGLAFTDTSDAATNCSFVSTNLVSLTVESTTDTDLSGTQFLMGDSLQQINVAGLPAIQGAVLGQPAVYVQKPSGQLQVLGIFTGPTRRPTPSCSGSPRSQLVACPRRRFAYGPLQGAGKLQDLLGEPAPFFFCCDQGASNVRTNARGLDRAGVGGVNVVD